MMLLRFVKVKDASGEIVVDRKKALPGRGVYLCPDTNCYEKAIKGKSFQRFLGVDFIGNKGKVNR